MQLPYQCENIYRHEFRVAFCAHFEKKRAKIE